MQAFSDAVFAIVANFAAQLALWKVPISAAELHQGALSGASLRQNRLSLSAHLPGCRIFDPGRRFDGESAQEGGSFAALLTL